MMCIFPRVEKFRMRMGWGEFGGSLSESTANALCVVLERMSSNSFVKKLCCFFLGCKVKYIFVFIFCYSDCVGLLQAFLCALIYCLC